MAESARAGGGQAIAGVLGRSMASLQGQAGRWRRCGRSVHGPRSDDRGLRRVSGERVTLGRRRGALVPGAEGHELRARLRGGVHCECGGYTEWFGHRMRGGRGDLGEGFFGDDAQRSRRLNRCGAHIAVLVAQVGGDGAHEHRSRDLGRRLTLQGLQAPEGGTQEGEGKRNALRRPSVRETAHSRAGAGSGPARVRALACGLIADAEDAGQRRRRVRRGVLQEGDGGVASARARRCVRVSRAPHESGEYGGGNERVDGTVAPAAWGEGGGDGAPRAPRP
mmetsp:Transcript_24967/g.73315  ORF Transcript_24967/g.73315 Transcript_24967/m.73315 type:complete len:279 (-) Transcript_24967:213-1049(-)